MSLLRGTASTDIRNRVAAELRDPFSATSEMVRAMAEQFGRRFSREGIKQRTTASKDRLDAIVTFIQNKVASGQFTVDEAARFARPSEGSEAFAAPATSAIEMNALATRLLRAIEKAHPEMASELGMLKSDRRR